MLHYKTVTPVFYEKFRCVGPECLISCCRGWTIHLDKKTHHQYLTASHADIATIARENLIPLRQGKNKYSRIKLDEQGKCPFLDPKQLCRVHRDMGESALSDVCKTYPRGVSQHADEARHTMTLSCPEVVRRVLFDPQGMQLHESVSLVAGPTARMMAQLKPVSQINRIIQLFAWNLIQAESRCPEENLMALAQFILRLQQLHFDLHSRRPEAEAFYHGLMNTLQKGDTLLTPERQRQPRSLRMKINALSAMGTHVATHSSRDPFIQEGHRQIARYMAITPDTPLSVLQEKFTRLDEQWSQLCQTSCLAEPYVLHNYLLYQIYQHDFPGTETGTIMRQFYHLVLDYFYLRTFLSVQSLHTDVGKPLVMRTIACLSEKTMHSKIVEQRIETAIDRINGGDDLSCLLLIG